MRRKMFFKTIPVLAIIQTVPKLIEKIHKRYFRAHNNNFYCLGNIIEYCISFKDKYANNAFNIDLTPI